MIRWLSALVVGSCFVFAQTGSIRIDVKDPSGASAPASGSLVNLQTGVESPFETDAQGRFERQNVPFGRYRAEISKSGFATQTLYLDVHSAAVVAKSISLTLVKQSYEVDVVATTPLQGTTLNRTQVAAPAQAATDRDIEDSDALALSDLMNRRLSGVNVNDNTGNPFQTDVNYRGYTASPLLGTPEGISVYLDGVRQNQPFGDIVAWDLIPKIAIAEVALVPGSNPLFGLNTLGGSVSLETKDGHSHPGSTIQISGGSFGRRAIEFEHGGSNDRRGFHWYAAGNLFHEDGWRQDSPSDVRQVFAKLGYQHKSTVFGLTLGYADNELRGNALQEMRFLARDYASVYTLPDIVNNRSPGLNFTVRHDFGNGLSSAGNAYYRYIRTDSFSADLNGNSFDQSVYTLSAADRAALAAAGYTNVPTGALNIANSPFPFWRCIAQALQKADPSDRCDASTTRTFTKQQNYGFAGQTTWIRKHNQFTAGMAFDRSSLGFSQLTQFGFLNPDRTVTTVDAYADGSTSSGGTPVDTRVQLHGNPWSIGFFATDTLSIGKWNFNLSGRYNRAVVANEDLLPVSPDRPSITGRDAYDRFNPAAGVTYSPIKSINVYASYAEASRAPTSIELGCSDANNPCNLPNAILSDPPLKQVVTRTFEAGIRNGAETKLSWDIGWFRAQNYDDLLFVASQQTGYGYFRNFGRTRRQGIEANMHRRIGKFTLGGNYTFVDATYQSPEIIGGSANNLSDGGAGFDGNIQIVPGDRIPLIPHHIGKAFGDYEVTSRLRVTVNFLASGSSYARGNENNLHQPDGVYYLGPGTSPGYGVTNLGARYQFYRRLEAFVQVNNLFNHRYYTGAQLGTTPFTNAGTIAIRAFPAVAGSYPEVHSTFYAPGAPIGAWGGIRFHF